MFTVFYSPCLSENEVALNPPVNDHCPLPMTIFWIYPIFRHTQMPTELQLQIARIWHDGSCFLISAESLRVAILELDSWSIAYPFLWLIGNRAIITNKSLYALHAGVSKVFESLRSGSCLEDQWTELQANWCQLLPAAASFELSITFRSRCLPHVSYSAVKGLSHLRVATAMPAQHWPPSARLTFQLDVSGFSKDS